jgi:hypothetical protein
MDEKLIDVLCLIDSCALFILLYFSDDEEL